MNKNEALTLALVVEGFDNNDESLPLELLKPIAATLRALATDYRAVKTYHEGKPVYVSQPEQKWVYGTPLLDAMSKDYVAPQRTWVGLTDDDIDTIFWGASKTDLLRVREIEAKLKEKNI